VDSVGSTLSVTDQVETCAARDSAGAGAEPSEATRPNLG
jgi:hypothetical protein